MPDKPISFVTSSGPPSSAVGGAKRLSIWAWLVCALLPLPALADDVMKNEHGGAVFHALRLELDTSRKGGVSTRNLELDGWVGGDVHRLWLKSEGEISDGKTQAAEIWGLYSRNIATFWDAQIGLRQDIKPDDHSYLAIGVNGLAPYFFETEAHLFMREDGALSARFHQENEVLLTNRLILKPRIELNLNARKEVTEGLGTGVTDAKVDLQLRYEITRGFAPYLSLRHDQSLGETADLQKAAGKKTGDTRLNAGIRFLF